MTKADDETKWHLDKRVPLALIATLVIQTGVALLYFGRLEERVTNVEARIEASSGQNVQIARIQERMEGQDKTLGRIEQALIALTAEFQHLNGAKP